MIGVWSSVAGMAAGTGGMGAEGSVWQGWKMLVLRDIAPGHKSPGWEGKEGISVLMEYANILRGRMRNQFFFLSFSSLEFCYSVQLHRP